MARFAQRRLHVRFQAGRARKAPQTYVAPLKGPNDVQARARFQHDLVTQFPNVSVIDFHEILETVRDVMAKVTLAISVVGGLVLFSGALILVGAVAMTKFQRVYEAAVFKTLGATTQDDCARCCCSNTACSARLRACWFARRGRADLGRQPVRPRNSVADLRGRARRRARADDDSGRGHRRAVQP